MYVDRTNNKTIIRKCVLSKQFKWKGLFIILWLMTKLHIYLYIYDLHIPESVTIDVKKYLPTDKKSWVMSLVNHLRLKSRSSHVIV